MAGKRPDKHDKKPQKEFDEVLLEVRRVTRVTTGGRQLSFRAIVLVGNRKGKIGLGVAKGQDVSIAVRKATHEAYKNIIIAPITENDSIPYAITTKYKAAQVKLLPAAAGTGLKAGSSIRPLLDLAGYSNILSKVMGTNNKLNNAIAALQALSTFKIQKSAKGIKIFTDKPAAQKEDAAEADDGLVAVTPEKSVVMSRPDSASGAPKKRMSKKS